MDSTKEDNLEFILSDLTMTEFEYEFRPITDLDGNPDLICVRVGEATPTLGMRLDETTPTLGMRLDETTPTPNISVDAPSVPPFSISIERENQELIFEPESIVEDDRITSIDACKIEITESVSRIEDQPKSFLERMLAFFFRWK